MSTIKPMGEYLRMFNFYTTTLTEADIRRVLAILDEHPWTEEMLDEATRGSANGDCDDPPEVAFVFAVALNEYSASRKGIPREQAREEIVGLAKMGVFNLKK